MIRPINNKHDTFYDLMKLKTNILNNGIFYPPRLLDNLKKEDKVTSGTGLYNYNDRSGVGSPLAPNEIHLNNIFSEPYRIESRAKISELSTNLKIIYENSSYQLFDRNTGNKYEVDFPIIPSFVFRNSSEGKVMGNIIKPMGKNYLRIYPYLRCEFSKSNKKCKFCGIEKEELPLSDKIIIDIIQTIKDAKNEYQIEGIFLATATFFNSERIDFCTDLISELRKELPDKEILFSLFALNNEIHIQKLYEAAKSQLILSFNLEVYNKNMWNKNSQNCLGIGKAEIGRDTIFRSLKLASQIGGKGKVSTNFVLGLEDLDSIEEGLDKLSEYNVIPRGTIYYATPGAIWTNEKFDPRVIDFKERKENFIIDAYLSMAKYVNNLKLKFPFNFESRISGLEWDAMKYLYSRESVL